MLQPPDAEGDLRGVDRDRRGKSKQRPDAAVKADAPAVIERRADDALQQIVAQRHSSDRDKRPQAFAPLHLSPQ